MNWQLVITILIIMYAVGYTIYALIQLICSKKSCGGACGGCNLKQELQKKQQYNKINIGQLKYTPNK